MKNHFFVLFFALFFTIILSGCGSPAPKTDAQKAAEAGISIEEYQQIKEKAAQMNMSVDEHMGME